MCYHFFDPPIKFDSQILLLECRLNNCQKLIFDWSILSITFLVECLFVCLFTYFLSCLVRNEYSEDRTLSVQSVPPTPGSRQEIRAS